MQMCKFSFQLMSMEITYSVDTHTCRRVLPSIDSLGTEALYELALLLQPHLISNYSE